MLLLPHTGGAILDGSHESVEPCMLMPASQQAAMLLQWQQLGMKARTSMSSSIAMPGLELQPPCLQTETSNSIWMTIGTWSARSAVHSTQGCPSVPASTRVTGSWRT